MAKNKATFRNSITTKGCLGLLTSDEQDPCEKFFGAITNKQREAVYDKTPRPAKIFLALLKIGQMGMDSLYDRLTNNGTKQET